jgi:hypothetical protein
MKFYPSDWRADPALRSCTIAARGLWVEMLALMHEAEPYGSLLINGARIDKKRLATLTGIKESECAVLLLELEGFGVFSRDDDGTIYSRRMRRDAAKAIKDKENGKKGGNPTVKGGVNPRVNGEVKAQKPEATAKEDRIADAGASQFTEGSKALTAALWNAVGIESKLQVPPELAGTDWRAIEWERAGWTVDLIDTEARRIGPGKPLSYYEKCFATSFAKRQAPLPVVEIREAEKLTVTHGTSRPANSVLAAIDRRLAALKEEDGADPAVPEGAILRLSSGPIR